MNFFTEYGVKTALKKLKILEEAQGVKYLRFNMLV